MLTIRKQPQYLRKTVRLPDGSLALVVFELLEIDGKITAKAVYGKVLGQSVPAREKTLSLPAYFETQHIAPVVSPFFAEAKDLFKNFAFITSQPTRAPDFI